MINTKDRRNRSTSWGKSSKWYGKIVGEQGHYYHKHVVLPATLRLLDLQANSRLVDLGSGQGVLARAIRQDVEYLGIDISGALIKQAKSLNTNSKHNFLIADASKELRVKSEKHFSHAAIILALQNMKDASETIKQSAKLLAKDGVLVVVINHPCFRIPRQSGWDVDDKNKMQKRWITKYMSEMEIPISTHPSSSGSMVTWSYHQPLTFYTKALHQAGFMIETIEELVSDKESVGKAASMENRSRSEFPLFMAIKAVLQS